MSPVGRRRKQNSAGNKKPKGIYRKHKTKGQSQDRRNHKKVKEYLGGKQRNH